MVKVIIGREREKDQLKQTLKSNKAEFLAVYGRRRVGKTFLIKNFFESQKGAFFYCSGLKDGALEEQIQTFNQQIGNVFHAGLQLSNKNNWMETFETLNKSIESSKAKKIFLFLDELPWLVTKRSKLLQTIDYFWNRYWVHDDRIKLIVCGSSASWIIKKIINDRGGLHNRVTQTMRLEPFTLAETKSYLKSEGHKFNNQTIKNIYMVLGGIPYYLSMIKRNHSTGQVVDDLCFHKNGMLVNEFERLFSSLFENSSDYIKLIREIAKYPTGLELSKLSKMESASDGGRLNERLNALEQAGFIIKFLPYGHKRKGIYFKVIDEYSLFYLRWIEPNMSSILRQDDSNGFWATKMASPAYQAWSGLAFEAICQKHIKQIRYALKIQPGANIGSWQYYPKNRSESGAQIDLLLDRDDGVISIFEIKDSDKPFYIDKAYAKRLENKMTVFKKQTKTDKQLFLVMILASGLKASMYSEELLDQVVHLDSLFKD